MGKFLVQPLQCWAESAPPGQNRVKVSKNLSATAVAPVAPALPAQWQRIVNFIENYNPFDEIKQSCASYLTMPAGLLIFLKI